MEIEVEDTKKKRGGEIDKECACVRVTHTHMHILFLFFFFSFFTKASMLPYMLPPELLTDASHLAHFLLLCCRPLNINVIIVCRVPKLGEKRRGEKKKKSGEMVRRRSPHTLNMHLQSTKCKANQPALCSALRL